MRVSTARYVSVRARARVSIECVCMCVCVRVEHVSIGCRGEQRGCHESEPLTGGTAHIDGWPSTHHTLQAPRTQPAAAAPSRSASTPGAHRGHNLPTTPFGGTSKPTAPWRKDEVLAKITPRVGAAVGAGTDREGLWVMAVLAGTRWRQACSLPLRGTPPHISLRAPPCRSLSLPLPPSAPSPSLRRFAPLPVTLLSLSRLLPAAPFPPLAPLHPSLPPCSPSPCRPHLPPSPSATRREGVGRVSPLSSFVVPFVILLSVVIDIVMYIHTPFINLSGGIEPLCYSRSPTFVAVILTHY